LCRLLGADSLRRIVTVASVSGLAFGVNGEMRAESVAELDWRSRPRGPCALRRKLMTPSSS